MVSKDLKSILEQIQIIQINLENVLFQKQVISNQISEIDNAISELEKLPENSKVFKLVGNLLIEKEKATLIKELKEKREILEIRLNSLNKQEDILKSKLKKLQEELSKFRENV